MSESKLTGRKVDFFRCHIDPNIGGRAQQAFKMETMKMEAELTPIGLWVRYPEKNDHGGFAESIVPYPNIQSIKLMPEESGKKK